MIIDRAPFQRVISLETIGFGTIMVVELEDMVQPEWHHVVDACLTGAEHERKCIVIDWCRNGIERLVEPFISNLACSKRWIPCQSTEGIPVGLCKMMPTPVAVVAYVGYTGNAYQPRRTDKREEFLPHGGQKHQMIALPQILLRDLKFSHLLRVLHLIEDGGIGFARLKVKRSVLRLQDYVVAELPIAGKKLTDSLHNAVLSLMAGTINERPPHDDTTMRTQRVGQHISPFGMRTTIVERTRLPLAVGFHKETAEIGNSFIEFVGLPFPPALHPFVERIGCGKLPKRLRRGEVHRQIDTDSIGTQHVGNGLYLIDIRACEDRRRRVYIVQHGSIDTHRGTSLGIVEHTSRIKPVVFHTPEDALPGITTLDATVKIVPMIQYAQLKVRVRLSLLTTQQGIATVEQSHLSASSDGMTTDAIAIVVGHG